MCVQAGRSVSLLDPALAATRLYLESAADAHPDVPRHLHIVMYNCEAFAARRLSGLGAAGMMPAWHARGIAATPVSCVLMLRAMARWTVCGRIGSKVCLQFVCKPV